MSSFITTATRRRGRPARDGSAMSRAEILQQAFTAFATHGYEHVSLRQLAQECGISDSLLSHHFGSKQQLWFEAADSIFAPLYQRLVTTLESISSDNVANVLRSNLKASLTLLAAEPEAMAFMFREGGSENERASHLRTHYLLPYTQRIYDRAEAAQSLGLMRKITHETTTAMVLGIMRMISVPGLYQPELAPHLTSASRIEAFVDEVVTIFYDGLLLPAADHSTPLTKK